MTQDEKWQAKYDEVVDFIKVNHRNPSKYRLEEHDMLNWLKANRKVICARCSIGSEIFKNNLVFLSI